MTEPLMGSADRFDSPWMTVQELARYLSVSAGTVRNWVSRRHIPFARRGRVVRFHREQVDHWLRSGAHAGRRRPLGLAAASPAAATTPPSPG